MVWVSLIENLRRNEIGFVRMSCRLQRPVAVPIAKLLPGFLSFAPLARVIGEINVSREVS